MIKRIVRLQFELEKVPEFLEIFEKSKLQIRSFKGCRFLELHREKGKENVFFTLSHWNSESDLENYRHSELFRTTWAATKKLFEAKPMAWSLELSSSTENDETN